MAATQENTTRNTNMCLESLPFIGNITIRNLSMDREVRVTTLETTATTVINAKYHCNKLYHCVKYRIHHCNKLYHRVKYRIHHCKKMYNCNERKNMCNKICNIFKICQCNKIYHLKKIKNMSLLQ